MSFKVDEHGDITIYQGDSGKILVDGIPTDNNYVVYFSVYDKARNRVGDEIYVQSNHRDYVVFDLTPDYTDILTVPKNEQYAIYFYGVKICDSQNQTENTLILGDGDIGSINTITVFPKKVEGI